MDPKEIEITKDKLESIINLSQTIKAVDSPLKAILEEDDIFHSEHDQSHDNVHDRS